MIHMLYLQQLTDQLVVDIYLYVQIDDKDRILPVYQDLHPNPFPTILGYRSDFFLRQRYSDFGQYLQF